MHRSWLQVLLVVLFTTLTISASAHDVACSPVELTGLQVAAGFVTWMNILRVFVIVGVVASIAILGYRWFGWLLKILFLIPVEVYEFLGYAASVGLLVAAYWISPDNQLWFTLGGSLLFGAMLMITGRVHRLRPNYQRFFGTLFIVWTAVALVYQSPVIGFIAVGALMGMIGFSAWVIPMGYVIGFRDESALSRATAAGFFILTAYVLSKALGEDTATSEIFRSGALWFGSFVGYLGLLIASSKWYDNARTYWVMQIVTVIAGMGAIMFGSLLDIPQLLGVGGTFFVLYLIEKPFEIPTRSLTGLATITLAVSATVGAGVWWAQNNMELVQPYLLF